MAKIHLIDTDTFVICNDKFYNYSIKDDKSITTEYPALIKPVDNKPPEKFEKNHVTCSALSTNGELIAVADSDKRLFIWRLSNSQWELIRNGQTLRKCIKIKFTHDGKYLLAADRAGDVYSFDIAKQDEAAILILGHLSMLLDMVISMDDKFVITSDRDEKIRVSNLPNAYNIHQYCLGHTEFVTCLAIFEANPDLLISGSGDGTLRLWRFATGLQICLLNYMDYLNVENKDEKIPSVKSLTCSKNNVAALFDGLLICAIYKTSDKAITHTQNLIFKFEPWDLAMNRGQELLVILPHNESTALKFESKGENSQWSIVESPICQFINSKWDDLKDLVGVKTDVQILYKQWFDNMDVYMEKKKQRLDKT